MTLASLLRDHSPPYGRAFAKVFNIKYIKMKHIVNSFAFITFLFPSVVFGQVIINEIAWMGVPIEGVDEKQWWRYEWLELYNPTDQSIGLNGWTVELSPEKPDLRVALHGAIEAQGYFLVASTEKILPLRGISRSETGVDVNYATLSGKFKNSGQRIVLKDAADVVVEELDASKGWFGGDNDIKLTMERRFSDRDASDPENWGSSQNAGGTPKAQNSIFGKEAVLKLDSVQQTKDPTKKDSLWSSFAQTITNAVFMRAFLAALLSAAAILLLRRFVLAPRRRSRFAGLRSQAPNEGSSDVLKD